MKVTIDGSGNITAHGDSLADGSVIVFPVNERPGFPTGWTVTGTAPHRVLKDPSHTIVASEDATGAAPAEHGVPAGGTADQVLGKLSDDDYDVGFVDAPSGTSVPDSAIATTAAGLITLSGTPQLIVWDNPPDQLVGTDLSVGTCDKGAGPVADAGIHFATAGIYAGVVWIDIRPSADADGLIQANIVQDGTAITDPFYGADGQPVFPIRPSSIVNAQLWTVALPPTLLPVGAILGITLLVDLAAGSVQSGGNSLFAFRRLS